MNTEEYLVRVDFLKRPKDKDDFETLQQGLIDALYKVSGVVPNRGAFAVQTVCRLDSMTARKIKILFPMRPTESLERLEKTAKEIYKGQEL